jgi:hypothetical protein
VTLGTYGHLFDTLQEDGADRLDELYRETQPTAAANVIELATQALGS